MNVTASMRFITDCVEVTLTVEATRSVLVTCKSFKNIDEANKWVEKTRSTLVKVIEQNELK